MLQLLQLIVGGAAIGCIYALIALGFVLIYKATETVNFAQGDLMMVSGFIGLTAMTVIGLPFALAFLVTIVAMALIGMATERLVLRPLLGQPAFTVVMMTIGLGYLARGLVTMIPYWGTETHTLPVPYKDDVIWLGLPSMQTGFLDLLNSAFQYLRALGGVFAPEGQVVDGTSPESLGGTKA